MSLGYPARGLRVGVAALIAIVFAGIGSVIATPANADSDEGTFVGAIDSSGIDTLNPFLGYANGTTEALGLIYPFLNSLDKSGEPGPYLAESWETSEDQLTWTFKIRDGLKWSDGKPITAEDAAWTLNLIMTNDVAATANGSLISNFASVKAPDDTTLVITTKKPQANVPYVSVPESGIPIVPKHIWKKHVPNLDSYQNDDYPIVGYGPWELVEHEPEQFVRFEANEDFELGEHGPPEFDELILNSFKNTDAAVAALRSGQIDYVDGLNPTQFESLENDDGIEAYQAYGDGWTGVAINDGAETRSGKSIGSANPILSDDKVRLAIHHAIDKETLVEKVISGHGVVGAGVMPPSYDQWFWQPEDSSLVEYDSDEANKILDDAGYERGDDGVRVDPKTGNKLKFRLGTHSDEPTDAQIAQYLKGWLKDVGITLEVEPMSFSKLNDDLAKGDWDMLMDGWHTAPDPTYQLSIQTCMALPTDAQGTAGYTDSFHCYPEYDKLFNKQLTTFDEKDRHDLVDELQGLLYEHNSNIFLYYSNTLGAVRTDAATDVISGEADDKGYYPVQTAFWHYLDAKPADSSEDSSSAMGWYVAGGAVVVLAIAGGGFALRRRNTADERE